MTLAPAQSLSFESEGNAGNAHENFPEFFAVESLRRFGRLEDSVSTAHEFGPIANPSRDYRVIRNFESMAGTAARPTRVEDSAARLERVRHEAVGRDFVAGCGVEDDCGRVAVELAREQLTLDNFRHCRRALTGE